MAMMVTTPPSCLRPPPDPPPPSCLKAPLEALSPVIPPEPPDPPDVPVAAVHILFFSSSRSAAAAKKSRTVCSSFTPSHHCLCSYSAEKLCTKSVSHDVMKMNFRSVSSEHQASSLNLALRALFIAVQFMDVEVSYRVKESIDFKLVSFQYITNQSLEDWLLIVKVWGVTCFVDFQLLPCYVRVELIIEDYEEVVFFSSAHWFVYFWDRPLFVTGASLLYNHYSLLTADILLPWSINQHRRIYTKSTEPISCIISEPKTYRMASTSVSVSDQRMFLEDKKVLYLKIYLVLLRLRTSGSPSRPLIGVSIVISPSPLRSMFTELRTVTMIFFVFGERAFYVMPDKFYITGVLSSTLFDQGKLLEISPYAVVLASTASPSSPNSLLLIVFEIHLVSWRSIIGVRADLTRLMDCLVKFRSSFGIFALFQTSLFECINVVFDYDKLFGASAAGIQVKTIFGFLYFEQASLVNTSILRFIVSLLFLVLSSISVVVVSPLSIAPVVTS